VRIVNDHSEVAIVRHALEPPGRSGAFLQRFGDHLKAVAER
jgi:hypothetical protein